MNGCTTTKGSSLSLSGEDKRVNLMWKEHRGRIHNLSNYNSENAAWGHPSLPIAFKRRRTPILFNAPKSAEERNPHTVKILWITVRSDHQLSPLSPELRERWHPIDSFYLNFSIPVSRILCGPSRYLTMLINYVFPHFNYFYIIIYYLLIFTIYLY